MNKRVAILTGGGDVPGLNLCLKSLVYRMIDLGFEPIGVRKGWEGLIKYNLHDPTTYGQNFVELTKNMVRPIDSTPGSFLHSSRLDPRETPQAIVPKFLRTPEADMQDLTEHIKAVIDRLNFRALITVGDDTMLNYAAHLSGEGVPLIAIPKTIQNNIPGTDYTLGFSSGLARGVAFIHELRALAGSREQIIVVETFGDKSGYSSLLLAFLSGAERALIPEVPYDPEKLAALAMEDKKRMPGNYAVVAVCNGSRIEPDKILNYTPYLSLRSQSQALRLMTKEQAETRLTAEEQEFDLNDVAETGSSLAGSGMVVAELLQTLTGEEVFLQPLTYLLRTSLPDGQDLLGATNMALMAARLLSEEQFGRMTVFQRDHTWTDIDLQIMAEGPKIVNVAEWYDANNYQPKTTLIWSV